MRSTRQASRRMPSTTLMVNIQLNIIAKTSDEMVKRFMHVGAKCLESHFRDFLIVLVKHSVKFYAE